MAGWLPDTNQKPKPKKECEESLHDLDPTLMPAFCPYYFPSVTIEKTSVRNGVAGRPSRLIRVQTG
ncbi:uncharacterized protein METZ01_LOCUS514902, partial [marine metagenome]